MAGGECKGNCESEGREDNVMLLEAILDLYPERVGVRSCRDAHRKANYLVPFFTRDPV